MTPKAAKPTAKSATPIVSLSASKKGSACFKKKETSHSTIVDTVSLRHRGDGG
jgi:hypothetical protein